MSIIRPPPTLCQAEIDEYYNYKALDKNEVVHFLVCPCTPPIPVIKRLRTKDGVPFYSCNNWRFGVKGSGCGLFLTEEDVDALIADVDGKAAKKKAIVRFFLTPSSLFYAKLNHIEPLVELSPASSGMNVDEDIDDLISSMPADGAPPPLVANTVPPISTLEPFPKVVLCEDSNGGSLTKPTVFVFPPTDAERRAMVWMSDQIRALHAAEGLEGDECDARMDFSNTVCPLVFTPAAGGVSIGTSTSSAALDRAWREQRYLATPSYIEWMPPVIKEALYIDFQMRLGAVGAGGARICRFKVVDITLPDNEVAIMLHHFADDLDGWMFGSADFLLIPRPDASPSATSSVRPGEAATGDWIIVDKERLRHVIFSLKLHEMPLTQRPCNSRAVHVLEFLDAPKNVSALGAFGGGDMPKPAASELTANHSFSHCPLKHTQEGKCDASVCGLCASSLPLDTQTMRMSFDSPAPPKRLCSLVNVTDGACADRFLVFTFEHFFRFCCEHQLLVGLVVDVNGRMTIDSLSA